MSCGGSINYTSATTAAIGGLFSWVARCSCGWTSTDSDTDTRYGRISDGTLDTARRRARDHLVPVEAAADQRTPDRPTLASVALPALDAPDQTTDSYDAWLRGLTTPPK